MDGNTFGLSLLNGNRVKPGTMETNVRGKDEAKTDMTLGYGMERAFRSTDFMRQVDFNLPCNKEE